MDDAVVLTVSDDPVNPGPSTKPGLHGGVTTLTVTGGKENCLSAETQTVATGMTIFCDDV